METMRDAFFTKLYQIAREDRNIVLLSADCGAIGLDQFRKDLSSQFINVGIAEANMISVAAGLALGGKKPYCYAIAPFASLRCLEQIKVDLCCMNLPVTILGVGAGFSYDISGPTHHATEDIGIMRTLPNITILNPSDNFMARDFVLQSLASFSPIYIRLDRKELPVLYSIGTDFREGLLKIKEGNDLTIISTGNMVHQGLVVAQRLEQKGISTRVVDLFRLKPVNKELLLKAVTRKLVTLEEHFLDGGIGSIVAEIIADSGAGFSLQRIGIPDKYLFNYGGRTELHRIAGIDVESVVRRILEKW